MACKRAATCRARFARGEQACVRCAEGKLDVGDVEDLDDDDIDDDDDDDDEEEEDKVGYTTQPNKTFGEITVSILIKGHLVPGIRVTVKEDDEYKEYTFVIEDGPDALPDDICGDIDPEVDRYAESYEQLYDVLEEITGRVIKMK